MEPYNPVNQLTTLLGPTPSHPWGALIPQVLLWCFRRFCIQKLLESSEVPLTEQLWEDYLQLITLHAPKGLEYATVSWMTPENINHVHSSLEEYNRFFIEFLECVDISISSNDSEMENTISAFLDEHIKTIIKGWLGEEYVPFLIFPMDDADEDSFTDLQFTKLIESLLLFSKDSIPAVEAVEAAEPLEPLEPEVPAVPEVPAEPLEPLEPLPTVKEVIARRKTLRNQSRITRGKTRKLIP